MRPPARRAITARVRRAASNLRPRPARREARPRLARRRRRRGADFLLRRAADELAERLALVKRAFAVAVDAGAPGPHAAAALAARAGGGSTLRLAPTAASAGSGDFSVLVGDLERLPLAAESADLVVSLLALHHVNDLPGAMIQIRRALRPDGLFVAALAGGDTLTELRQSLTIAESEISGGVSPRVAPFADARALGGLMQRAGFALPVVDVDTARRALRRPLRSDARPARLRRRQRAHRAQPQAAQARGAGAGRGGLSRAFRRLRRAAARDIRDRLADRLGAA